MKKLFMSLALVAVAAMSAFAVKHEFRTVPDDPLQTKIYTLPNGLQVFMSVNKDQPRIQTYIAVRVGGKNDPYETTGLAHYFEHLMFKGTEQFGTMDYAAEKPMLDRIEALFEDYRHTTDSVARRRIYHEIDSVSYEASKVAIPNEYDKLMSAIGATGTNAYTSYDVTCYMEDIPSNQIENWARIQADRFEKPVIRGFHTELETIYEEKNMSLTKDNRKVYERLLAALYPSHPYGRQTVLGTQGNLKNPSITNVKAYHKQWYVPNNMAICLSGDFDPDEMVDVIEKYFGHLKPNPNLNRPALPDEKPFTAPVEIEVLGPEAENLTLVWRIPEASSKDMPGLNVLDYVFCNGTTGIFDINVTLPQLILGGSAGMMNMADAGAFSISGTPKNGQTLDDVRTLLLAQVDKLRKGEFSDEFVEAVKANIKLSQQNALTKNDNRADEYVSAFVNGIDWADKLAMDKAIENVTKADIVALANKYLGSENYVALYKRTGADPAELKIGKPDLTPIVMNRDAASPFLLEIQNSAVKPIEPVFIDFDKDLTRLSAKKNVPVLYVPNTTNDIFELIYVYDIGTYSDSLLQMSPTLMNYCGTSDMTPEQVKNEFYKLACRFSYSVSGDRTFAVITGLSENMDKAVRLYEKVLADAVLPAEAYDAFVERIAKSRVDAKLKQNSNFSRLSNYVLYGPQNPSIDILTPEELRAIRPEAFTEALRNLNNYEQTVIYYGKAPAAEVVSLVNDTHPLAAKLQPVPRKSRYNYAVPEETTFFIAPYEAKQLYMVGVSNKGEMFDHSKEPLRKLYNDYFGGSMNSIVFQEMRESRSLAYNAGAGYYAGGKIDKPYIYRTNIATQNDKLMEALAAFDEIIENMPRSESAFELSRKGLEGRLRTERIINDDIAFYYLDSKEKNYDYDARRDMFDTLGKVTLDDIAKFQQQNVAGRVYHYGILAKPENIDIDALRKLGKVVILSQEDIFGY